MLQTEKKRECPREDEQALYDETYGRMRGSRIRFFFPLNRKSKFLLVQRIIKSIRRIIIGIRMGKMEIV